MAEEFLELLDARRQFKDLDNTKYKEIVKEINPEFKRLHYNANQDTVEQETKMINQ